MQSHDAIWRWTQESFCGQQGSHTEAALRRAEGRINGNIVEKNEGDTVQCEVVKKLVQKCEANSADSNADQCGEVYHGPFCGVSSWVLAVKRRMKLGIAIWGFKGKEMMVQYQLVREGVVMDGNQGAVLRLLLELVLVFETKDVIC